MTEITLGQLLGYLRGYGTAVHCEMYGNYTHWYTGDGIKSKFYYDRGCAIVFDNYEYGGRQYIHWQIHQTSPDAEIDAVTAEYKAEAAEYAKKYENPDIWVVSFVVSNGELPPEKDKFYGWRNYSRKGGAYPADPRVRELTPADCDIIKSACAASLENDTSFGKKLANDFIQLDFENLYGGQRIFGIFDGGILAGMATRCYEEALGLAWLRDIFIVPGYRRKSFGSSLVLTVLSEYPDVKWHYQVAKQNEASVGLAKSLGFTLEGAGLFVY